MLHKFWSWSQSIPKGRAYRKQCKGPDKTLDGFWIGITTVNGHISIKASIGGDTEHKSLSRHGKIQSRCCWYHGFVGTHWIHPSAQSCEELWVGLLAQRLPKYLCCRDQILTYSSRWIGTWAFIRLAKYTKDISDFGWMQKWYLVACIVWCPKNRECGNCVNMKYGDGSCDAYTYNIFPIQESDQLR